MSRSTDKTSKTTPAYRRIEEDIRSKVKDGRLLPGAMLANRHSLARQYGVALSTAQQAVANLVADGTLASLDRRGTFVAGAQIDSDRPIAPLTVVNTQDQSIPESSSSKWSSPATIGILATSRIHSTQSADVGSLWSRLAIRSLEQVVSASGGITQFFERYPESGGPYPRGLDDPNALTIPQAIKSLLDDGVQAIAVVGLCDLTDMSDEVVRAIDVEHIPAVYISWHEIQPPLAQVYYDNRVAGYQAAQHLLRKGYRDIVFLNPFEATWLNERIEGAEGAIRHGGMPQSALRLYPSHHDVRPFDIRTTPEDVQAMAMDLLRGALSTEYSTERVGIIAPQDEVAYAIIAASEKLGKVPGRDFGLIGFDDDPRSCVYGLSTIRPPVEAMGEQAGRILLDALKGGNKGLQVRMHSHLIPRASTRARPLNAAHSRSKRKEVLAQSTTLS